MEPIQILYGILLAGSFVFGFEVLIIGLGGRLIAHFQTSKKLFKLAFPIGLVITGFSIGVVSFFDLDPLYLAPLLLGLTILSGKLVRFRREKLFQSRSLSVPRISSEEEMKSMLRERGFGEFVEDEGEPENN